MILDSMVPQLLSLKYNPTASFQLIKFQQSSTLACFNSNTPFPLFLLMKFLLIIALELCETIPSLFSRMSFLRIEAPQHSAMKIPSPFEALILFSMMVVLLDLFPPSPMFILTLAFNQFFSTVAEEFSIIRIPFSMFLWILFRMMWGCASLSTFIPDFKLNPIRVFQIILEQLLSPQITIPFSLFPTIEWLLRTTAWHIIFLQLQSPTPFNLFFQILFLEIKGKALQTQIPVQFSIMQLLEISHIAANPILIPNLHLVIIVLFTTVLFSSPMIWIPISDCSMFVWMIRLLLLAVPQRRIAPFLCWLNLQPFNSTIPSLLIIPTVS